MHTKIAPISTAAACLQSELADRVGRHALADGVHGSAIRGLTLMRASVPSQQVPALYEPSLCIVVQGRKRLVLADELYVYDPLNYLVVSVTLPARGHIIDATPDRPYLCLRISIDTALIKELLLQLGPTAVSMPATDRGVFVARAGAPLLDAVLRLTSLLDHPRDAAVLAPLVMREIYYRVLTDELGHRLRALCVADSHAQRIARVIRLLKSDFATSLRIEDLAATAHMSASALHHKFKELTAMSPMQFQKQLRLHEARRLMLTQGLDASAAGQRVGYESPSQFNREYRRLFGAPPRREIETIRADVLGAAEI